LPLRRRRWIRPTGNWSPALLERVLLLPLTLPPFPRPDMMRCWVGCRGSEVGKPWCTKRTWRLNASTSVAGRSMSPRAGSEYQLEQSQKFAREAVYPWTSNIFCGSAAHPRSFVDGSSHELGGSMPFSDYSNYSSSISISFTELNIPVCVTTLTMRRNEEYEKYYSFALIIITYVVSLIWKI
jgi:hypothetical protein